MAGVHPQKHYKTIIQQIPTPQHSREYINIPPQHVFCVCVYTVSIVRIYFVINNKDASMMMMLTLHIIFNTLDSLILILLTLLLLLPVLTVSQSDVKVIYYCPVKCRVESSVTLLL